MTTQFSKRFVRPPSFGMTSAALALLLSFAVPAADAQVTPYVGYNTQYENTVYGAAYQVPIGRTLAVSPSLEAGLGSGDNYVQAGADLTANLSRGGLFVPYLGLGVAAGSMPINGETKARVGGNALAGVRLGGLGGFTPFAQARYTNVRGGDAIAVQAGASLRL